MNLRKIIRVIVTTLSIIGFIPMVLFVINIEELAKQKGWDQILAENWGSAMLELSNIAQNTWFLVFFGVVLGGTIFMWFDYFIRNLDITIIRANIPTSIRLQFIAGSTKVLQLANENVRHFYGERAQFQFLGENNELLGQNIIWYAFLTFKKATSYGQIVVDAGNAQIPEYHNLSQTNYSAVIRFEGDIGNIALTIKCISANQ